MDSFYDGITNELFILLPTTYVVREEVIFSLCVSVHTQGGIPTFRAGGKEGGTYLPRSGWGGVPNFRVGGT